MKPRIFKKIEPDGCWYVQWRYPGVTLGHYTRRCYAWSVAIEQLHRLYSMGDVDWKAVK